MTVCRFFLQGQCRFGQNCRFEHTYNNDDRGNRNSINSQQLSNIVKQMVEEVILAEKGGQWPLSSFSPIRGGASILGWEDVSPEEVRWKIYQAKSAGNLNQCIQEINQMYNNAEKMRNLIKEPTTERVNLIVNLLKSKREPSNSTSHFSDSSSSSSIFGGSPQSSGQNIFRSSTSTTGSHGSIFGGSTLSSSGNVFGGSNSSSVNVFGSSSASSVNVFGGSPPSSANVFGGSSTSSANVFGGSPPSTANVFGGSNPPSTNIFGGSTGFSNQNIFGGSNSSNTFTQSSQNPSQNLFSSSGNGNIFSNAIASTQSTFSNVGEEKNQNVSNAFLPTDSSGIFSTQTSNGSLFSSKSTFSEISENQNIKSSNIFGASQNENIFKSHSTFNNSNNIFSNQQALDKTIFGGGSLRNSLGNNEKFNEEFDSSVYSKVEDLSEEEVKSFKSVTFVFGKIPLKPPPKEYCK